MIEKSMIVVIGDNDYEMMKVKLVVLESEMRLNWIALGMYILTWLVLCLLQMILVTMLKA